MRTRSETWINLTKGDFLMDARVEINGKIYTRITAPRVDRALMSAPLSVGNCASATLSMSILTDDVLDARNPIVLKGRLMDRTRTQVSESLQFGTFYLNQRASHSGLTTIQCYDTMLKANQNYLSDEDTGADWPKYMSDVVTEIAYRLGVGIDARTLIVVNDAYLVSRPTGLTMRQVLGYIGACMGGNWIITEENLLRLVPMNTIPGVVSSSDQMSDEITPESTINGYTFYITDEVGRPIVTKDGFYLVWAEDDFVPAEMGLVEAKSILGDYDLGEAITVTGVYMTDADSNIYTAGDISGPGVIRVEGNPYANQSICDDLFTRYEGLVYAPYTANKVIYDPAAELGDQIIVRDKIRSVLYTTTLTFDALFTADIGAPNSEELTAEYPYLTEIKRLAQSTANLRVTIEKTAEDLEKLTESSSTDLGGLSAALTAEIERASSVEADLADRLGKEETRAKQAEQDLQANIDAEETRATTAENALRALIDAQAALITDLTTRLSTAEATIADLVSRVSALEGGTDPEPDPEPDTGGTGTGTEGGTDTGGTDTGDGTDTGEDTGTGGETEGGAE